MNRVRKKSRRESRAQVNVKKIGKKRRKTLRLTPSGTSVISEAPSNYVTTDLTPTEETKTNAKDTTTRKNVIISKSSENKATPSPPRQSYSSRFGKESKRPTHSDARIAKISREIAARPEKYYG